MNVLIYGAGNSVAIFIARYLSAQGHTAILADSTKFARGFYSRYCTRKYLFRDPSQDAEGFSNDLKDCVDTEKPGLILPTTDEALINLVKAQVSIPDWAKLISPLDYEKIRYVFDKSNIPSICEKAGVHTAPICVIDNDFRVSDTHKIKVPCALKKVYGIAGDGFRVFHSRETLEEYLEQMRGPSSRAEYLLQEFVPGRVYGAGAVFEDNELKQFFSYEYIRRYPKLSGPITVSRVDYLDSVREEMQKILRTLEWDGFCHMDFILEEKTRRPCLIDINPVHWYSVPNSSSDELNCLSHYLNGEGANDDANVDSGATYTTISLYLEAKRILAGETLKESGSPADSSYWRCLQGLRWSDFYWDPLPMIIVPLLRILRRYSGPVVSKVNQ